MSDFVKVEKNGEVIEIAPSVLAEHQRLGWKIVVQEPEPQKAQSVAEEALETKASKPSSKKSTK